MSLFRQRGDARRCGSRLVPNVSCGIHTKIIIKKRIGANNIGFLKLTGRFVWLGDRDVNPRVIQRVGSEARGDGMERGNSIETSPKPSWKLRGLVGDIYTYIYVYIYIYIYIRFGASMLWQSWF